MYTITPIAPKCKQINFLFDKTYSSESSTSTTPQFLHKKDSKDLCIKLIAVKEITIQEEMQQLAERAKNNHHTVYGIEVFQQRQDQKQVLSSAQIHYLCGCYLLLNFELIQPSQLKEYLESFSCNANDVDDIRVENKRLKIDKLNRSLIYDFISDEVKVEERSDELDRSCTMKYVKSVTKMNVDWNISYFTEVILQVESNQYMLAVRTNSYVYVLTYQGKKTRFQIKSADIKWTLDALYIFSNDGYVRIIQRQILYAPSLNQLSLQKCPLDSWHNGEFLVNAGPYQMAIAKITSTYIYLRSVGFLAERYPWKIAQGMKIISGKGCTNGKIMKITAVLEEKKKIRSLMVAKFQIYR